MKSFLARALVILAFISLQAHGIIDFNANGVSDLWERNFNHGELFPETFDPSADPDGDGWTNAQEAVAGTDPSDANPPGGFIVPQITHFPAVYSTPEEEDEEPYVLTPEAVTIVWPTLIGKQYTLLFSPDLSAGSWIPVGDSRSGTGGEIGKGIPLTQPDGSIPAAMFWRVAVDDTDTDGDGLTDFEELEIGSSIYLADTDGDGIDDATAYAAGNHPAGVDSDGDGVPDSVLYSVEFEVREESRYMDHPTGYEVLVGIDPKKRYQVCTTTEEYSISDSARYGTIADGLHTTTYTYREEGDFDWTPAIHQEGTHLSDWKWSSHIALGENEYLVSSTTQTQVTGPTTTATETFTTTTHTTPWEVKERVSGPGEDVIVRSGTETITVTNRTKLTDPVTYQDLWTTYLKPKEWAEWDESRPSIFGPHNWRDYNRAYFGDADAAEAVRDYFRNADFGVGATISDPGSASMDFGSDHRLKSFRWRWVRFNPLNPFALEYAAPPAAYQQRFHLLVQQRNFLRDRTGNPPVTTTDEELAKGVVEIDCNASDGTGWHTVNLDKFSPYKLEEPTCHEDLDFSNWGYSQVWFENLPVGIIPGEQSVVSADDHKTHITLNFRDGPIPKREGSIIEWQIRSGDGGSFEEAETFVKDGLSTATLNTTTIKDTKYIINARIKTVGTSGGSISQSSVWIKAPEIKVVAGKPATFTFATTKTSYRSDGTDTSQITATIKDQFGNLVEDGTPVSWSVDQTPSPPFNSVENSTAGGIAKAMLRAPLVPEDQIVVCNAGDKEDTTTFEVQRVTGSLAGDLDLDIGTGGQSVISVTAQAADGTPVYWTTSNGEITAQSTIANGSATATLQASGGRLGKVVVTATVGDRLLFAEGEFISSAALAIGAEHPVLIASATANGFHTPTFPHGISRSIPYYATTPVRIKGPANGLAQLTVQASLPLAAWDFDELEGNTTPSRGSAHEMTLTNATIDEDLVFAGEGSLAFEGNGIASVPDSSDFHFTDQLDVSMWVRPSQVGAATLAAKSGSWNIIQLADGRIQAAVTTGTGTYSATTGSAVQIDEWTLLTMDFRFNRLQIRWDNRLVASAATTGTLLVTNNGIELGDGFRGHLDQLAFRAGASAGFYVNLAGVGAGNTVQLDANGEGSFTVTSSGQASGDTSIRIFSKVNPEAETEIALVDPDAWDYTCDTIMSFIGGDPATNAGTVSSIAGGFLLVGDIGSCTKNLWRMTGWSDKDPNYVELSLGGLGILTTFAEVTVVGAPADAGVASVKTLAIRFGNNPKAIKFLTVFLEQIKNAIVGRGGFGWAEANFLKKMVTDIPVSEAFKLFMHDDGLAKAAVRATEKLGANAESFYQATRRAVASHGEEAAKKFVQAFEGLGDEAFNALKNAPAGELHEALDGLAKITNKGIAPFSLKRILDNTHLYGSQYKRTNLLKDLGELSEVPGLESAVKMLKINHPNVKGFRYEIEGAATLSRSEQVIHSITERVSVVWDDIQEIGFGFAHGHKTDIDVITGVFPDLVFRQFKSTAGSMKSLKSVQAWCEKARKARLNDVGDYEGLMFHLPPDEIPKITKSVKDWLDLHNIPILPISMKP